MTGIKPLTLAENYWDSLHIENEDLDLLYNHLLEIETPQTPHELIRALINFRIQREKKLLELKQSSNTCDVYIPKNNYEIGMELCFPALDWSKGKVIGSRKGSNPEFDPFDVISVRLENGAVKEFACGVENHSLNMPIPVQLDDPLLDPAYVLKKYGKILSVRLLDLLESNPDIVQIAGRWFPRALLVDINLGHLNLAEALLEEANGGPLTTNKIIQEIDLPTDVNPKLTEFSLNLALQEDTRFDEIGASGEILWFLHRLEPDEVQSEHPMLRYFPIDYHQSNNIEKYLPAFDTASYDELSPELANDDEEVNQVTVTLIYPHWRAGTIPLTRRLERLFPTAYESPRVLFTFVDNTNKNRFSGWVVRPHKYVFGLKDWYDANNLFPGCQITLSRGEPGEIIISLGKKHPTREWVRTLLVGADGGLVYAMLKQQVYANFDERMAIAITDTTRLDELWNQTNSNRNNLDTIVRNSMIQLSKLSPQGHVHAQELYAVVNLVRRCPPGPILDVLFNRPWSVHLGDLYFRYQPEVAAEEQT